MSASAGVAGAATKDIWINIKTGLLKTTEEVCGQIQPHCWHRKTWWWNEHMEKATAVKWKAFKAWKNGKGTRASYEGKSISNQPIPFPIDRDTQDFHASFQYMF